MDRRFAIKMGQQLFEMAKCVEGGAYDDGSIDRLRMREGRVSRTVPGWASVRGLAHRWLGREPIKGDCAYDKTMGSIDATHGACLSDCLND